MPRKRRRTNLQRKTIERVLRLEFAQADDLSNVLQQAAVDARNQIDKLPANSTKAKRLREITEIFETTRIDVNRRLRQKGRLAETLNEGLSQAVPLTADAGNIPKSSVFNTFTPVLPLEALSLASSEYVENITSVTSELKRRALSQTKIAIAQGEGIEDIKRRLIGAGVRATKGRDGVFRRARWRAELIGRTLTNDLVNRGRMIGYTQIDKEFPELELQKRWSAVTDGRTSDICKALDNQVRDLKKSFEALGWSGDAPPAHVNCRSAVIPEPKPYVASFEKQWTNDATFVTADDNLIASLTELEDENSRSARGKTLVFETRSGSTVDFSALAEPKGRTTLSDSLYPGLKVNEVKIKEVLKDYNGQTYDIMFSKDGKFSEDPLPKVPANAGKKARKNIERRRTAETKKRLRDFQDIKARWPELLDEIPKNSLVYNDPIGGHDDHRSRIYKRFGMGDTTKNYSKQWAIVREKDGEKFLEPVNFVDPEQKKISRPRRRISDEDEALVSGFLDPRDDGSPSILEQLYREDPEGAPAFVRAFFED
ncbi:putative minor head protein [Acaryochloris phage A-HIS1]|nr:putative minor head protein [Acaryochloris phage A-HIS1]